jgi:hypothetical protein
MCLQAGTPSPDGTGDRLDRIVKGTGEPLTLTRAAHVTAIPQVRNETEVYEWRDVNGRVRVHIVIDHHNDAVEARERLEHLKRQVAARPLNGIGDAARIASIDPTGKGPATVHFIIDWIYIQVSAPTGQLAVRLAGETAKELRP